MNARHSIMLPLSFWDVLNIRPDAEVGQIVKAIYAYLQDGTEPEFEGEICQVIWQGVIKPKLDSMSENYQTVVEKRRQAGKESAASKRKDQKVKPKSTCVKSVEQNQHMLTSVESVEQNQHMPTCVEDRDMDRDMDMEGDRDRDSDRDKTLDSGVSNETPCHSSRYDEVMAAWNDLPLQNVRNIQGNRLKMLNARIKENSKAGQDGLAVVLEAIRSIKDQPFLLGQNKNAWTVTFDWFVKPNNFQKVLEGNYLRASPPGKNDPVAGYQGAMAMLEAELGDMIENDDESGTRQTG